MSEKDELPEDPGGPMLELGVQSVDPRHPHSWQVQAIQHMASFPALAPARTYELRFTAKASVR